MLKVKSGKIAFAILPLSALLSFCMIAVQPPPGAMRMLNLSPAFTVRFSFR